MVNLEAFIALFRLLNEPDRAIVELYVQGHSVTDIARELKLSPSTVCETIYRFRQRLEKENHYTP